MRANPSPRSRASSKQHAIKSPKGDHAKHLMTDCVVGRITPSDDTTRMPITLERCESHDPPAELDALRQFLLRDDQLRSIDVDARAAALPGGAMGAATDALLVTLGSGGVAVTLIEALASWLRSRRSKVRIKLTMPDREVELDITTLRDPAQLKAIIDVISSAPPQ
jgi:microcystin degradation protein MlrC